MAKKTESEKLKLCFVNEAKEEKIKKHEYNLNEVNELLHISYAIEKLSYIASYYMMSEQDEKKLEDVSLVFDTIEMLIQPISHFLDGGKVKKEWSNGDEEQSAS